MESAGPTSEHERRCLCVLCVAWPDSDPRVDHPKLLQDIDNVIRYGWHVQGVLPTAWRPPYAYTVGVWHTFAAPELAVFGIPWPAAAHILNAVGDFVRGGRRLRPGDRIHDQSAGHTLVAQLVHPDWIESLLGVIPGFYQVPPVSVLQLVWPDRDGHYPGDDGFDPEFCDRQPYLWQAPVEHPRSIWTDFDELHSRSTGPAYHPDCPQCRLNGRFDGYP